MKNGKLYLIPTPIGNLKDITFRAVEILEQVDIIGAEDTRNSGKLLKHYEISTPQRSYHKFNEKKRSAQFVEELLRGKSIALITDAGTPGISDPASLMVEAAISAGIQVEALPGATAFVPALVGSGLESGRFYFAGFLPEKPQKRSELLEKLAKIESTLIFYVSPHDLDRFAEDLVSKLGNRQIVFARELTKLHEEYIRTSLAEVIKGQKITLKGEFVAVVEGYMREEISEAHLKEEIKLLKQDGISNREMMLILSRKYGINQNKIKKLLYT